jgi:hypothetical protein
MATLMRVVAGSILVLGPVVASWAIWKDGIRNSDHFFGSVFASFWVAIMWMMLASQM